jgi:hypothetical protein
MRAGACGFRRLAACLAASVVVLILGASPVSAQVLSGPRPTDFRSRVVAVTPAVPGVEVRVVDLGARIELTNRTRSEVLVLGYEDEPYLRVGPRGVYENLHSAATYIDRSTRGGVVPLGVDTSPTARPEWRKISDGDTARWHDHRAHWMGGSLPPLVVTAPGRFHHISVGFIVLRHGGATSTVHVALDWVPGPSAVPWIPLIVALLAVGFSVALVRGWSRVLAMLIVFLVAVCVAQAVAYEMARPGSIGTKVGHFVGAGLVFVVVSLAGVPTVVGLWRRRVGALYGAFFVGVVVALAGGASDVSSLWRSQLPSAGPDWLTRAGVAVALGLGGGVALGSLARSVVAQSRRGRGPEDNMWLSSLVVGLDEDALRRITSELDVDEVLAAALADLADRLTPDAPRFSVGTIVFDVTADDARSPHTWSLTPHDGGFAVERGQTQPVAVRFGTTFPLLLQLLAGTAALDTARATRRVTVTGPDALVAMVDAHLAERATVPTASFATDPEPAA